MVEVVKAPIPDVKLTGNGKQPAPPQVSPYGKQHSLVKPDTGENQAQKRKRKAEIRARRAAEAKNAK